MTNPWEEAAKEHDVLRQSAQNAKKHNEELHQIIKTLKTQLETLRGELENAKARSDHYLRLYCEICKNLNTIGLVVDDALNTAHIEVAKRNGSGISQRQVEQLVDQVEQAVTEMKHEPVQHEEGSQRGPTYNEVHRRS